MILRTCVVVALLIAPAFVYSPRPSGAEIVAPVALEPVILVDSTRVAVPPPVGSILFVGDLMLGRRVETMAKERGFGFPFASTTELLNRADITVGNLEGTVPDTHIHTPDLTYRFSFQEATLVAVREAGFSVLSLANNHSFDYGKTGYEQTVAACVRAALTCLGNANRVSSSSVQRVNSKGTEVVLLMINATYGYPEPSEVAGHLREMSQSTALKVAYIHWGDEYALRHNEAQEDFAHRLIDGGIDAVIGHHPHVVQDVALYKGKPIFYSLGNFVFDQYFSDDVQVGLAVSVLIDVDTVTYELIPLTTLESRSQPRVAEREVAEAMWNRITENVRDEPFVVTSNRSIVVPRFPGR